VRVLTVTNMWPTPELPYLGIFVERQVQGLREAGVDVDVLFVNGRSSNREYVRAFGRLGEALRAEHYDLIHANYVFSGVIARRQRRLPIVLMHHGVEVLQGWQAPLCWLTSRVVDAVVVKSEQMRQRLGLPGAAVIPSALDLEIFRRRSRCPPTSRWSSSWARTAPRSDSTSRARRPSWCPRRRSPTCRANRPSASRCG
jgi:hypothetical protein